VQARKIMKLRFREPGILSNKDCAIVNLTACLRLSGLTVLHASDCVAL